MLKRLIDGFKELKKELFDDLMFVLALCYTRKHHRIFYNNGSLPHSWEKVFFRISAEGSALPVASILADMKPDLLGWRV